MAGFIPALFLLSNDAWAMLMLALSLLGLYEWASMVHLNEYERNAYLAVSLVLGVLAIIWMRNFGFHMFFYKALAVFAISTVFWVLIVPFWFAKAWVIRHKFLMAILGLFLMASLWMALVCAKGADPILVLILLPTIWIADSAAYFAGKNFGKHKLAPTISPGKTWEGVAGALIAVTLFGVILRYGFDLGEYAIFPALWIITILGVMGDLFESLMKRQANIKDSGDLLPGHGGILDRIDGLIPSVPIAILMIYVYSYYKVV